MQWNAGYNATCSPFGQQHQHPRGGDAPFGLRAAINPQPSTTSTSSQGVSQEEGREPERRKTSREGLVGQSSASSCAPPSSRADQGRSWGTRRSAASWKAWVNQKFAEFLEENPAERQADHPRDRAAAHARMAARKARDLTLRQERARRHHPSRQVGRLLHPRSRLLRASTWWKATRREVRPSRRATGASRPSFRCAARSSNVEKARLNKILSNTEIQAMISACGNRSGRRVRPGPARATTRLIHHDRRRCRRGAHPHLILTFLFRNMVELIDAGYVYIAQAPALSSHPETAGLLRLR